ncbi:MAG: DNA repair protein RecO C-terminal domain-containing protein [Tepidisphaeraceae bacterium]
MVRVIAKGAFRRTKAGASKFDGGLDLLDFGECLYLSRTNKDLSTLTDWKLLDGHLELRRSLPGVLLGQAVVEIIGHLLPDLDPHPVLFDRLHATLPVLVGETAEAQFLTLLIDLLTETGYLPDFTEPATPGGRVDPSLARLAATLAALPRDGHVVRRPPKLQHSQVVAMTNFLFAHVREITGRALLTRPFLPG